MDSANAIRLYEYVMPFGIVCSPPVLSLPIYQFTNLASATGKLARRKSSGTPEELAIELADRSDPGAIPDTEARQGLKVVNAAKLAKQAKQAKVQRMPQHNA